MKKSKKITLNPDELKHLSEAVFILEEIAEFANVPSEDVLFDFLLRDDADYDFKTNRFVFKSEIDIDDMKECIQSRKEYRKLLE